MDYATLLVKRGELLRKIAKILFWILVGSLGLLLITGIVHSGGKLFDWGRWGRFLSGNPRVIGDVSGKIIDTYKLLGTLGYIGMGLGLLSPTVYFAALHFLGLGQIAKNTEK